MCNEMIKLRQMLTESGVEWEDFSTVFSRFYIHRTHFKFNEIDYSVINGCGTYGGYTSSGHNEGLLELMGEEINGGEPVGWLTAEQVLKEVGVIRD